MSYDREHDRATLVELAKIAGLALFCALVIWAVLR
jgi:hypothetical protein